MDLLKDKISKVYLKYLAAAFGSTLIISIYSLVDCIVIGRYEGPNGAAAVAAFTPMWSIMFAFGLMLGIGGSVLMAQSRGAGDKENGNRYFSATLIITAIIMVVIFAVYNIFSRELIYFFGGRDEVLDLACIYSRYLSPAAPLFILGQVLIPFIRNDNHPGVTTASVVAGGVFNMFGDVFFVFGLDMGIKGAGIATALGQVLCMIVLIWYMFSKKCTIKFRKSVLKDGFFSRCRSIVTIGASAFVVDLAIGVLAIIMNNQIMAYSGPIALAIYGVISSLAAIVQSFGYAVGESAQAIMSINFGARQMDRVVETRKLASKVAVVIGIICCAAGIIFPQQLLNVYMKPTREVMEVGPQAVRIYFIAFIFLVFNVTSTYYFQSVNKPAMSLIVSLARGIVISAVTVFVFPLIMGETGLWIAIPVTEAVIAVFITIRYKKEKL